MDNHRSEMWASAFAYTEETYATARTALARNNTDPGGELTRGAELARITHRCNDRSRRQWTDAGNCSQSLTTLIASLVGLKLLLESLNP